MKTFIKILCLLLLAGCKSATETPLTKLEDGIKKYIDRNAHDPSTYEPINTYFIDTLYNDTGIEGYTFMHECRLANGFGAITLSSHKGKCTAWFSVYSMDKQR